MAEGITVGIPRALLYYVYQDLWLGFFENLGVRTVLSPPTNKQIIRQGIANTIDEACYSSKVYIGHVDYLIDKCDMVFVPRIENSAIREEYCTRLFGLYDLVRNTFPGISLLHADVNYLFRKKEPAAFIEIGQALGKGIEESLSAYESALLTAEQLKAEKIKEQEALLAGDGLKALIVSHAYNTYDADIGQAITDFFAANDVKVIYADLVDSKAARAESKRVYGNRIYWKLSAELIGGIEAYRDQVDGIVLLSTFPCGPDSIFNELMIRLIKDKPLLSLVIDEQDASAGILTRLESFYDIIEAKSRGGALWG